MTIEFIGQKSRDRCGEHPRDDGREGDYSDPEGSIRDLKGKPTTGNNQSPGGGGGKRGGDPKVSVVLVLQRQKKPVSCGRK